jgi:hypothetical protein
MKRGFLGERSRGRLSSLSRSELGVEARILELRGKEIQIKQRVIVTLLDIRFISLIRRLQGRVRPTSWLIR